MALAQEMKNLLDAHFNYPWRAPRTKWFDVYNLTPTGVSVSLKRKVAFGDKAFGIGDYINDINGSRLNNSTTFNKDTMENFCRFAECIEDWYTGKTSSTYRESVFENADWCALYQKRTMKFAGIEGTQQTEIERDAFPCFKCGILFPKENITIDHQYPQEGGMARAALKTLRALGLTVTGPSGKKATLMGKRAKNILAVPTEIKTKRGHIAVKVTDNNKTTLTDEGIAFFSIAKELGGGMFGTYCMHSIINMKPLCGYCNTSKGKHI